MSDKTRKAIIIAVMAVFLLAVWYFRPDRLLIAILIMCFWFFIGLKKG